MKSHPAEFSGKDLKLLNEIGQSIMANLEIRQISETVYENINQLMDANVFGIGIYREDQEELIFKGAKEKGKLLSDISFSLKQDKGRLANWCFTHQKPVLLGNYPLQYKKYVPELMPPVTSDNAKSIIYVPLIHKQQALGVLTVQSFRINAYSESHLELIKNIALFTAIAISNANIYKVAEDKSIVLEQKLSQIKEMQSQLVQSERLASLGQLTAGIAHELNNPINYLYGGAIGLEHLISDIMQLLDLYKSLDDRDEFDHPLIQIKAFKDKIYYEETLDNIKELSRVVKEGAERSIEIIRGLQNFARPADTEKRPVDLNELIDKTLLLLRGKWKNMYQIHKHYDDKLPAAPCYPVPLGQVLLNILNNAFQAIEEKGNIYITTKRENNWAVLEIKDDGKGMKAEVLEKIFEPFFTTKRAGEGTGLGLSISYGIIKKHEGKIEVKSAPRQGTTFIISLPIALPKS